MSAVVTVKQLPKVERIGWFNGHIILQDVGDHSVHLEIGQAKAAVAVEHCIPTYRLFYQDARATPVWSLTEITHYR